MTILELEPAEIPLVAKIVAENHAMEPHGDGGEVVGRAQHRKHHGCVAAVFRVVDDVPMELRHGVFADSGAQFEALIRFSNGRQ